MKKRLALPMILLSISAGALADEASSGRAQYLDHCAACHGPDGRGDGPLGDQLVKRPSDLTTLAQRNGGAFPYWRVFAIIDGRYVVPEHGDRDMPVWGRQFLPDEARKYGPNAGEVVTTERIHELTGYVESLQRRADTQPVPIPGH
jgi:mono/diheme cytochrome c family protein